jgi:hypothetical protein
MLGKEGGENGGKDKDIICHICDRKGHKEKKCWYYDATSREENRKKAQEKIKEKQEAKKKKQAEKKAEGTPTAPANTSGGNGGGVPHIGTIVQLPPKTELAGLCNITAEENAGLYCEPCNAAGVRPGQIDFIYDSGTGME